VSVETNADSQTIPRKNADTSSARAEASIDHATAILMKRMHAAHQRQPRGDNNLFQHRYAERESGNDHFATRLKPRGKRRLLFRRK